MRKAMAEAEVGDEQSAADPSTNALQERVADLLGKEAAVFLPSGTMCNQIALLVHCRRGDEVIAADRAHILNAQVASGVSAKRMAAPCDSVWLDLSKGLGCPVGGVLAGSRAFIEEAWAWKHRMGGAMRQSGVLAAAGLYALDHNVERLAEDHANARRLAEMIGGLAGIRIMNPAVESNIVFFDPGASGRK